MSFVHLHLHSHFSFLDGLGKPTLFAKKAKELGMPGVALTDSGNLHGAFEMWKACKAEGINPILGLEANISKKAAQFSYEADSTYYFMDLETYDTYELTAEQVDFNKYFIVEGAEVSLMFFEGELLSVSVPEKVELTVAETDPAIKGAPSNQTKDATTDTGLTLRVPQFIEPGEKIVVFSTDGKYAGRA